MRDARCATTIVATASVALVCLCSVPAAATARLEATQPATPTRISVIVRERSPRTPAAEALIRRAGGTITRRLPIVGGFAARIPVAALAQLAQAQSIASVSPDARIRVHSAADTTLPLQEYDALDPNRVWQKAIGLPRVRPTYDGTGVSVALLDTGVTQAADLLPAVRLRLDFTPGGDGIDRFGHGTHMAGIIAGNGAASQAQWAGVAPGARLISIKIAGPDGATDASVVLAALQWIVSHKDAYHIGVLNLSFGTDSTQSYVVDPLDYAVERVWRAGIVVVAAAGNAGPGPAVSKPGDDPFVITVGADNANNTVGAGNDKVAEFSGRGPTADGISKPDLLAPGISIVSVRAPGSTIDRLRLTRLSQYYTKGSGTSQATAIVSGLAALLLQANPALTPDQVKAALLASPTGRLRGASGAGAGLVVADRAIRSALDPRFLQAVKAQAYAPSSGSGSIDASRGTQHPFTDFNADGKPDLVTGEIDALGAPWDALRWPRDVWSPETWRASPWAPLIAIGSAWDPATPPERLWPGLIWSPEAWSSKAWSDSMWVSKAWSSKSWSMWN
jgi:serine protease AprX